MPAALLADFTFLLHALFVLFVIFGGWISKPRVIFLHGLAVVWAIYIQLSGNYCPLTYLENYYLAQAGQETYDRGFLANYLEPILYPQGLQRWHQWVLAVIAPLVAAIPYLLRKLRPR